MQSGPVTASTTTNIRILVVEEFGFSQLTKSDCYSAHRLTHRNLTQNRIIPRRIELSETPICQVGRMWHNEQVAILAAWISVRAV